VIRILHNTELGRDGGDWISHEPVESRICEGGLGTTKLIRVTLMRNKSAEAQNA
jgi:hypothetical protein